MSDAILIEKVLAFVTTPEYRPMKPRMILKVLKLPEDQYRELRRAIKHLVSQGRVIYGANHLVLSVARTGQVRARGGQGALDSPQDGPPASGEVVGIYRAAPSMGYGFVEVPRSSPVAQSATASDSQDGQQISGEPSAKVPLPVKVPDIFIPESRKLNAMDGDTVRVRLRSPMRSGMRGTKESPRHVSGRLEGEVVEVVARKKREFTGTFQSDGQKSFVWLDGAKLERPVTIGDVRGLPLENNDKVVVELVKFPDEFLPGEAVILRVLGSMRNPAVDTMAVMIQYSLPEEFPEAVIEDARAQADRFSEDRIPEGRKDLTAVPTLTIDPVDARDFDDAISLSKNEKGNWELQVHIADVAFFVPVGSLLDEEARQRGNSVYLPDRVIPMLPETISNHLASLQPDRRRLAKTVFMEYTPEGVLIHA
ncbi:MAG: RNB domain-containing ribonuclease, partial [Pirellula sp.]